MTEDRGLEARGRSPASFRGVRSSTPRGPGPAMAASAQVLTQELQIFGLDWEEAVPERRESDPGPRAWRWGSQVTTLRNTGTVGQVEVAAGMQLFKMYLVFLALFKCVFFNWPLPHQFTHLIGVRVHGRINPSQRILALRPALGHSGSSRCPGHIP